MLQSVDEKSREELTPLKLRKKAAKFATATVKAQMESFKVAIQGSVLKFSHRELFIIL